MNLAEKLDCQAIPDRIEKIGPLGGLYSCLSAVSEDLLFFTPVDAPFTNTDAALHYARRWNSLLTQFLKNMPACLFIQPVANSRLPLPMQKHVFQTLNA